MKRVMAFICAGLSLAFSNVAYAEDWRIYADDETNTLYYYDLDSIKSTGYGVFIIWSKADHSNDKTEVLSESKIQYRLNCTNQTITMLYYVLYRTDGKIDESHMLKEYEQQTKPAVPGSIGESLLQKVCP